MAAAYDTYDYPAYWITRKYEHDSELLAISSLLSKIPRIRSLLEIGAGYGRLTASYLFRARRVILSDPSSKLLSLARAVYGDNKKVTFLQSGIANLPNNVRVASQDAIVMIRVLHHLEDIDSALGVISKLLKKRGYLLIEFANKRNLKATFREFLKGNFTFPLDIFTKDMRSKRSITKGSIAFLNYHPDMIQYKLESHSFRVKDKLSVSNIRSPFLKKLLPTEILLIFERILQKPLGVFYFGPSIFVLAQKKG